MFTVPDLSYEYNALEPAISAAIMRLHHDTHHVAYVTKLNAALEGGGIQLDGSLESLGGILADLESLPETVRTAVRNNGGGHYNHSLFWQMMTPGGAPLSAGSPLDAALTEKYGSIDAFKESFTAAALGLFGSGWVWLQPDLSIVTSPNQDSPLMNGQPEPLLGLDVWEHAYYLDYHAARKDYVDAWWGVVNWKFVEYRFQ